MIDFAQPYLPDFNLLLSTKIGEYMKDVLVYTSNTNISIEIKHVKVIMQYSTMIMYF